MTGFVPVGDMTNMFLKPVFFSVPLIPSLDTNEGEVVQLPIDALLLHLDTGYHDMYYKVLWGSTVGWVYKSNVEVLDL